MQSVQQNAATGKKIPTTDWSWQSAGELKEWGVWTSEGCEGGWMGGGGGCVGRSEGRRYSPGSLQALAAAAAAAADSVAFVAAPATSVLIYDTACSTSWE